MAKLIFDETELIGNIKLVSFNVKKPLDFFHILETFLVVISNEEN